MNILKRVFHIHVWKYFCPWYEWSSVDCVVQCTCGAQRLRLHDGTVVRWNRVYSDFPKNYHIEKDDFRKGKI